MAVTLTNGQTVTSASFLSGGHKTYFVPSLESTYSWAAQASASATAAAQSAQAAAASAQAAANAGSSDVSSHAADLTKHLTSTQNTLLDGITATFSEINALSGANPTTFGAGKAVIRDASGYIITGYINTTANDVGAAASSRLAVEVGGDRLLRWQTPANFFKSLGRVIMENLSQGRYLRETNNGVMQIGGLYGIFTGSGPITMSLPTFANTYNGATIEFFDLNRAWGSVAPFTLTCDGNSAIGNRLVGQSAVYNTNGKRVILTCSKETGQAFWAEG